MDVDFADPGFLRDPYPGLRLVRESGGWWTTTIRMPAGRYEMNVRVNGGRWIVPPGLEASKDEFGGAVGILVLGR